MPSVLVACPTARIKDYCLQSYLTAYKNFAWDEKGLYIVDNTDDGGEYLELIHDLGVSCDHIVPSGELTNDIGRSWQNIFAYAKDRYDYILSLEIDTLAPSYSLQVLVRMAEERNACMVRHSYWARNKSGWLFGLGCVLMEADLVPIITDEEIGWPDEVKPMNEERRWIDTAVTSGRVALDVHNLLPLIHVNDDAMLGHNQNRMVLGIAREGEF
jgi:hypothetical protein